MTQRVNDWVAEQWNCAGGDWMYFVTKVKVHNAQMCSSYNKVLKMMQNNCEKCLRQKQQRRPNEHINLASLAITIPHSQTILYKNIIKFNNCEMITNAPFHLTMKWTRRPCMADCVLYFYHNVIFSNEYATTFFGENGFNTMYSSNFSIKFVRQRVIVLLAD